MAEWKIKAVDINTDRECGPMQCNIEWTGNSWEISPSEDNKESNYVVELRVLNYYLSFSSQVSVKCFNIYKNDDLYAVVPVNRTRFDSNVAFSSVVQMATSVTAKLALIVESKHLVQSSCKNCPDCGMPKGEGHWTFCKRHEVY